MHNKPVSTPTLPDSRAYALLGHHHRRLLIRLLQDFEPPLSPMELAELLADCEHRTPTDRERTWALLALYHNHLPKLDEASVIDYDPRNGTVEPGSNFGLLVGIIEHGAAKNGPFAD